MILIERICKGLNATGIRYAVVGGYAVAIHGAVRGTVDIDIAIAWNRRSLEKMEAALNDLGLQSTLPVSSQEVFDFRDEYVNNRNLIAWNFFNPGDPTELVDVIIDYDLKGKTVKKFSVSGETIPVLSLKDLIEMKRRSGREQDLIDVEALKRIR